MSNDGPDRPTDGGEVAAALAALFNRLGFAAVIRHPDTADVIASTPDAELALGLAEPGTTRIASGRVAGELVRVELVPALGDAPVRLTKRQLEVARLLADGLRNGDIAERLGISSHTVRRHMEAILRRLNVTNRAAAAKELRNGRADGVGETP
jgi:DNA-binding NarL/FixJ family response regulator